MLLRLALLGVTYAGLGILFVKSHLERRAAVHLWRQALGGSYDHKQRRFATELELDRAKLPKSAAHQLRLSRQDMGFALMVLPVALTIQLLNLGN
jgi:hypothetical protein